MANGHVVAQDQRPAAGVVVAGVGDVQHRAVLDAATVADADLVHVASDYGHGPDRAILPHLYISDDHGAVVYPGAFAKLWCDTLVSSYIRHYIYLNAVQVRCKVPVGDGFQKHAPSAHPCDA